jgi:hypothetical protein
MTLEEDQRDDILDALDNVLQAYQQAKLKVTNEVLLLRHIWLDVDKVRVEEILHLLYTILQYSINNISIYF